LQRRPFGFDSEDGPVGVGADPVASDSPEQELVRVSEESAAQSVATGDRIAAGVAAVAGRAAADPAAAVRPLTTELPWGSAVACLA
jgi:cation transporter-like permease